MMREFMYHSRGGEVIDDVEALSRMLLMSHANRMMSIQSKYDGNDDDDRTALHFCSTSRDCAESVKNRVACIRYFHTICLK